MSSLKSWSVVIWRIIDGFLPIVLLFICLLLPATTKAEGQILILLLDTLQLEDLILDNGPNLQLLQKEGSLGLMNTRTGDSYHPISTHLTLGAGRRAIKGNIIFDPPLEVGEGAYLPYYEELYQLNRDGEYGAIPGLLGQLLQEQGLTRILITGSKDPMAFFLLMDREGRNPITYYQPNPLEDLHLLQRAISLAHLLLLELGEMDLKEVDELLGFLLKKLHPQRDLLILLSPTPSFRTRRKGSNLTPILAFGQGMEGGALTSNTTRQDALVTNLDLLPTILSFFSLPPLTILPGGELVSIDRPMTWEKVDKLHQSFIYTSNRRPSFIKAFVFSQIILLALFLLLFLWPNPPLKKTLSFLCRFLFSIPLIALFLGFYAGLSPLPFLLILLPMGLFLASILPLLSSYPLDHMLIIFSLTIMALLLDLLFGPYLLGRSLLGYDPIIGARFYGIGNEYMGILLGASVMGSMALWDRLPHLKTLHVMAFFLMIILFMGLPFLGANLGGTFSALFLFSLTLLLLRGSLIKVTSYSMGITFLFLFFLLMVEKLFFTPVQSHIGKTLELFGEEGFRELYPIILRKLGMNLKLMRWTIWTRVLLSFILFLAFFFKRPHGLMERVLKEHPHLTTGLKAALVGSIITMVVNDSGVVAMATLLFFPVFSLFYLVLDKL